MNAPYPHFPGFKSPGTSQDAAERIEPRSATLRRLVMGALESSPRGLTADECAAMLGESVLSIRPRFSEMARMGMIEESGERRRNESGARANVYRAALGGGDNSGWGPG